MGRPKTARTAEIRSFILVSTPAHPSDLVRVVSDKFGISRQAASRHVGALLATGEIAAQGERRQRVYSLKVLVARSFALQIDGLEEHIVWLERIKDAFVGLPDNVVSMWNYGCSEMINNAIDHSAGRSLVINLERDALSARVAIIDDGVGIFRKIKEACHLEDERQSVLELAKGKFTTDPKSHTGEGIFFTSRIMDEFTIISGDVIFSHEQEEEEDWILKRNLPSGGTAVFMKLASDSSRTAKDVMNAFAAEEHDYGFTKTVVPVRLVSEGADSLVSRSQAKRLLSRLDKFRTVLLDFDRVDSIGRPFADEIFRVFANANPNTQVIPINANDEVARTIAGVVSRNERN